MVQLVFTLKYSRFRVCNWQVTVHRPATNLLVLSQVLQVVRPFTGEVSVESYSYMYLQVS